VVNTKSLILYFGLKFGLKYNETNTKSLFIQIYLELVSKFKSNNESMIKTPKQQTLTMETKFFHKSKYVSFILH
jgi:hypothetical protein